MTRETKLGLVIGTSFVSLAAVLLFNNWNKTEEPPSPPEVESMRPLETAQTKQAPEEPAGHHEKGLQQVKGQEGPSVSAAPPPPLAPGIEGSVPPLPQGPLPGSPPEKSPHGNELHHGGKEPAQPGNSLPPAVPAPPGVGSTPPVELPLPPGINLPPGPGYPVQAEKNREPVQAPPGSTGGASQPNEKFPRPNTPPVPESSLPPPPAPGLGGGIIVTPSPAAPEGGYAAPPPAPGMGGNAGIIVTPSPGRPEGVGHPASIPDGPGLPSKAVPAVEMTPPSKVGAAPLTEGTGLPKMPTVDPPPGEIPAKTIGSMPPLGIQVAPLPPQPAANGGLAIKPVDPPVILGAENSLTVPVIPVPAAPSNVPPPHVEKHMEQVVHTQPGDDFAAISKQQLGSPDYAQALYAFNRDHPAQPLANSAQQPGGLITPGTTLFVPDADVLKEKYGQYIKPTVPVTTQPAAAVPQYISATPLKPIQVEPSPSPLPVAPPPPPVQGGWSSPAPQPAASGSMVPVTTANNQNTKLYWVPPSGKYYFEIARETLGDGQRWGDIWRLNPNYPPETQVPGGTQLRLPADARLP